MFKWRAQSWSFHGKTRRYTGGSMLSNRIIECQINISVEIYKKNIGIDSEADTNRNIRPF